MVTIMLNDGEKVIVAFPFFLFAKSPADVLNIKIKELILRKESYNKPRPSLLKTFKELYVASV